MSGNVWEMCSDWFGEDYYANSTGTNPQGPSSGQDRVMRGGGWDYYPDDCHSTVRGHIFPRVRYEYYGFRIAASL